MTSAEPASVTSEPRRVVAAAQGAVPDGAGAGRGAHDQTPEVQGHLPAGHAAGAPRPHALKSIREPEQSQLPLAV